jgi:hypothetical protein
MRTRRSAQGVVVGLGRVGSFWSGRKLRISPKHTPTSHTGSAGSLSPRSWILTQTVWSSFTDPAAAHDGPVHRIIQEPGASSGKSLEGQRGRRFAQVGRFEKEKRHQSQHIDNLPRHRRSSQARLLWTVHLPVLSPCSGSSRLAHPLPIRPSCSRESPCSRHFRRLP